MNYCPHCMRDVSGAVCPHCGGQVDWDNQAGLLPVGTVLPGVHSYRVGAAIGQGGFGITYIARDMTSGQRVAVKEYFPIRCAQRGDGSQVVPKAGLDALYEGGRYSFLQEARMLASLEGMPAVVQGLEYLETNNTAYLVMEFLDGTPLYQIVNQKGRILAEELMPRLRPLLRDIGKLHAKGILHRDISPDNIMWMPDGTLKLLDFGCARSMEDGKSMTLLVKKGFAPLEQYQRHGQGPYTDVYALAATVYYCLTGVIPPESTERQLSDTPLQSPIALGAALTPEEEKALLWGLELNPKTRPANMEVFSQRLFYLDDFCGGDPGPERDDEEPAAPGPAGKRQDIWQNLGKLSPRGILVCVLAAVLALLLLVLVFAGLS